MGTSVVVKKFHNIMSTTVKDDPEIKVTRMQRGWGVRLFNSDGTLHSEDIAKRKNMIGPVCRDLLRWYAKCALSYSKYADRARHRAWGKGETKGVNAHDKEARFKDMRCDQTHIPNEKH